MLNCFIFVLQSPRYLWSLGELVPLWFWVGGVKWNSTLTRTVERLTIVFLLGCWKQEIFLNTCPTLKSKGRNKGVFSFCQAKDTRKLSTGAESVLCPLSAGSDHCHFQGSQSFVVFRPPLPSDPAVFPAPVGLISPCLQSVTPHAKFGEDLAR